MRVRLLVNEMIYLFTGVPGAGKTLNAIKFVNENEIFQGRDVYYTGIAGLKLDWNEITVEEFLEWWKLPQGSVIVVDEMHKILPPRTAGMKEPKCITELTTHRHYGFDIVFITQSPKRCDHAIRDLIGKHFHFVRKHGRESVTRYTNERIISDVDKVAFNNEVISELVAYDKTYFDLYASAELHTHKRSIPKKLVIALVGTVFLVLLAAYSLYSLMTGRETVELDTQLTDDPLFNSTSGVVERDHRYVSESAKEEYIAANVPVVEGMPWTAPKYAEIMNSAESVPLPKACINMSDKCNCYSWQGTLILVSYNICMDIVRFGFFDSTRSENAKGRVSSKSVDVSRVKAKPFTRLIPDSGSPISG